MTTDAHLIAAARTDPRAFAELYRRHARAVDSFLSSRMPAGDASALTAEPFAPAPAAPLPGRAEWIRPAVAARHRAQPRPHLLRPRAGRAPCAGTARNAPALVRARSGR